MSLEQLNELSDTTPVLVNLKPVGNGYMEDFFAAGGMGALLRELKPLLHLDCMTVTGETLGERLACDGEPMSTARSSRRASNRSSRAAGSSRCSAISRREGAILKRSAADAKLFEHEGRAVVFSSLADLAARIDDPALDVDAARTSWCCRTPARTRPRRCRKPAICRSRRSSRRRGVKDMIRISDARMSGTAFGTIVLHVTPDAASGGPLGLVRNGDRIRLSVKERRIDLLVDDAELNGARRADACRARSPRAAMPSSTPRKFSAPTRAATLPSCGRRFC